jgi:hypothetical protein
MEPRREESRREEPKVVKPRPEDKPKRLRIVPLEPRIAPISSFQWGIGR